MFELKKYRAVIFHEIQQGYNKSCITEIYKIYRGTDSSFQSWPKEFDITKLKKDRKFAEESTCRFKIRLRNITKFDVST